MKAGQRFGHVGVFERHAFAHVNGRGPMIQPYDDDLFLHGYSKRPPCRLGKMASPQRK
jgi:hypothetical protein